MVAQEQHPGAESRQHKFEGVWEVKCSINWHDLFRTPASLDSYVWVFVDTV